MIGKFRRFLKEACPECGKMLEVRAMDVEAIENGIPVSISEEYIACSNCDYERDMEKKRRRRPPEEDVYI